MPQMFRQLLTAAVLSALFLSPLALLVSTPNAGSRAEIQLSRASDCIPDAFGCSAGAYHKHSTR